MVHSGIALERNANKGISFEVVSIRHSRGDSGGGISFTPDGFRATAMPISKILMLAYLPKPRLSDQQDFGGPSWVRDEPYDIVAKVAPSDISAWRSARPTLLRKSFAEPMLQAMLVDRCKLLVHAVPVEVSGFSLVQKGRGTKLRVAKPGDPDLSEAIELVDGATAAVLETGKRNRDWTFSKTSMKALVMFLNLGSNSPVEDRTGLSEKYNFDLRSEDLDPNSGVDSEAVEFREPLLFRWDLDALGLKLQPSKIESQSIVIDHIERPSEN